MLADRDALDEALASLPLRPWLEVAEVTTLLPHPVSAPDLSEGVAGEQSTL